MYTVLCDNCGKDSAANQQYACWSDKAYAEEVAMEGNWIKEGILHYCPECYTYDDNDELHILPPKKQR